MTKATPDRVRELARMAKSSTTRRKVEPRKLVKNGVPLTTRDDRLLAERLRHALRYPYSPDAVLIDISAAQVLLDRVASGLPAQEIEHDGDD